MRESIAVVARVVETERDPCRAGRSEDSHQRLRTQRTGANDGPMLHIEKRGELLVWRTGTA
jgi:hypothetical protein